MCTSAAYLFISIILSCTNITVHTGEVQDNQATVELTSLFQNAEGKINSYFSSALKYHRYKKRKINFQLESGMLLNDLPFKDSLMCNFQHDVILCWCTFDWPELKYGWMGIYREIQIGAWTKLPREPGEYFPQKIYPEYIQFLEDGDVRSLAKKVKSRAGGLCDSSEIVFRIVIDNGKINTQASCCVNFGDFPGPIFDTD